MGTLAEIKETAQSSDAEGDGAGGTKRGESLGALSRKFVSLFLDAEEGSVLTLENAAVVMQRKDAATPDKSKTKVRRLYDVANIFAAIGIISKKRVAGVRKPGFVWNAQSPLLAGKEEFFTYNAAANEDEDEMDEMEDDAGEPRDEYKPSGKRRSARQKRKLFDRDEEVTAASSQELMARIAGAVPSAPVVTMQPGFKLAPLPALEQQENMAVGGFVTREGRALNFPDVKKETNSPQVKKQAIAMASPETEKTV